MVKRPPARDARPPHPPVSSSRLELSAASPSKNAAPPPIPNIAAGDRRIRICHRWPLVPSMTAVASRTLDPPAPASVGRRHAFTVDVEDWHQGIPITSEQKASAEHRLERGLDRLLETLAGHEVRGTFFILGPIAERYPGVVRRIASAGHELGCHGWSHDLLYAMTPERLRDETVARSR